MLKNVVLILLLFSLMTVSGCSPPEPSLQDKLNEIDSDLQWALVDITSALEYCEGLEKELNYANTAEWEVEGLSIIKDSVFDCSGRAEQLVKRLSELEDDIGDAMYRLNDIVWEMKGN
ncbi:hypothetical protein ACFLXP_04780 [Chloroflexota bacterium]